jgi:hypothetical protein
VSVKGLNFRHPSFCFVLYVNNLSERAVASIDAKLRQHKAYLGYLPCTFSSLAKTFTSMYLMNFVIKQGNTIIMGHEDDRPNTEDYNLHMHDYVAQGFRLKSIQSMYFSTFLAYKPVGKRGQIYFFLLSVSRREKFVLPFLNVKPVPQYTTTAPRPHHQAE